MYINRENHSLDDKGRLIIPKKSILTKENDILFVRENSLTFSLYNIDEYNKLLEELKLKKKIYSIMNCYEKAGNLYQMIESLIQVFVYHHVFERSCRWQVL